MCVRAIVDASAFRHFLEPLPETAGGQFRKWIDRGDGLIVLTSETQYDSELKKYHKVQSLLKDYLRRGLVLRIEPVLVEQHKNSLPNHPIRQSDDPHILALAAASDATVLFSCDTNLQKDFANPNVLTHISRRRRRSVQLQILKPEDTTQAKERKRFLNRRKCMSR